MFNFLKNPKFRVGLFIFSALAALFIFVVFYLILANNYSEVDKQENEDLEYADENYYDNGKLVYKVPDLGDILTGPIISSLDPMQGNIEAPVSIVIFADFECNFCRNQEKIIQEVFEKYKDKVKLIWKDYPEDNKESISYIAAVAARCAYQQDSFWDYHDKLFSVDISNVDDLIKVAEDLDLNTNKFKECLEGPEAQRLVDDNIEEANALNINGVPFIYINDQEIMGEMNFEDLEKIVEIEIKK